MTSIKSKILKNIITSFGGQFIIIVLGLIIPRLLISSYGSDVNGLLSTITQIFSYMALLEAGIGQAAKNLLYKPLKDKDNGEVSNIASIARLYFRKFTIYYGLCVVALAFILPFILKTNVDAITIWLIVFFEGMSGVISFYFIETPSVIISADGKNYINNGISLVNKIVGYFVKIIMASFGLNVALLQFVYFLVTIAKVFFYNTYFKKHYGWLAFKKVDSGIKLKDRNSYILSEICWTIFNSTDMIVLSMFVSTKISSVYSIYNMIFSNLTSVVTAIYMSITYLLAYAYHESISKYEKVHDAFNSIFIGVITILMSVCYVLIIPFVKLYTKDIADVEYIYNSLPVMFCLIQLLSWIRYTSGNLTGIAGYAKQTSYVSLAEALINLSLSILLAQKFGIIGVTLATIIALPLKVIWCTYVSDKKVMNRSYKKSVSIIGINFLLFFSVVLYSKFWQPSINSYSQFFIWGIILFIVIGAIGITLNLLVNKDCWSIVKKYYIEKRIVLTK
jgi:O-antigen/teichoic acid export membrane protein